MSTDKQRLYSNARNFVKNFVEERGEVTTKELSRLLKQQFYFNSNQVSGLLNKMSTTEKTLIRVGRGIYVPYKNNTTATNVNIKYNRSVDTLRKDITAFFNENIGKITSKELLEIQKLLDSLNNVQDIINSYSDNNS